MPRHSRRATTAAQVVKPNRRARQRLTYGSIRWLTLQRGIPTSLRLRRPLLRRSRGHLVMNGVYDKKENLKKDAGQGQHDADGRHRPVRHAGLATTATTPTRGRATASPSRVAACLEERQRKSENPFP